MAKKAKAKKAKTRKRATGRTTGAERRRQFRSPEDRAGGIVGHVLVHFGAGYGAQRQTENATAPPANLQIFGRTSDSLHFHAALMESTLRNLAKIDWETNQGQRDAICAAAFAHGVLARQTVVADGTPTLSLVQILTTLKTIQGIHCPGPGGAGGGPVCDF